MFCIFLFFSIYHIKHAYYGHIATINSHFPEQFASLNLFSIISILVATTLFFFSFLLGSFVVRRFIYQEKDWTLEKVLQQYSQLLAIQSSSLLLLVSLPSLTAYDLQPSCVWLALESFCLPASISLRDLVNQVKPTPSISYSCLSLWTGDHPPLLCSWSGTNRGLSSYLGLSLNFNPVFHGRIFSM